MIVATTYPPAEKLLIWTQYHHMQEDFEKRLFSLEDIENWSFAIEEFSKN